MKRFDIFLAVVAVLAAATTSSADTVKLKGKTLALHGQIIRTSNVEVEIETLGGNGVVKKCPSMRSSSSPSKTSLRRWAGRGKTFMAESTKRPRTRWIA